MDNKCKRISYSMFFLHETWILDTRELVELVEKSFENEIKKIVMRLRVLENQNKSEETEDETDYLHGDYCTIENDNKQLFRSSIIISMYSFLELQLKRICHHIDNQLKLKVRPNDFAGKGIDKFLKYILFASDIDVKNNKKYKWSELERMRKIRNALTHEADAINNLDKDIKDYISKNKYLKIQYDQLIIDKEYLFEFLDNISVFLDSLGNHLIEKLPNIWL